MAVSHWLSWRSMLVRSCAPGISQGVWSFSCKGQQQRATMLPRWEVIEGCLPHWYVLQQRITTMLCLQGASVHFCKPSRGSHDCINA